MSFYLWGKRILAQLAAAISGDGFVEKTGSNFTTTPGVSIATVNTLVKRDGSGGAQFSELGIGVAHVAGTRVTLASENDAVTPTLAFGDGDTGFYEFSDDAMRIAIAGGARWQLDVSKFHGVLASSGMIRNIAATATVPSVSLFLDDDTGLGRAAADQLSLIAGGVEGLRVTVGGVGIGGAPVVSAVLDVASTTKGFLPPRMTNTQRDAIGSPASGLSVYDATNNAQNYFNGTAWRALVDTAAGTFVVGAIPFATGGAAIGGDSANLFWDNVNKRLGIGTNTPTKAVDCAGDVRISGNLIVAGSKLINRATDVLFSDNHLHLNQGYTTDAAQTGGLSVWYDPSLTTDSVSAGAFVAGDPGVSNPTVVTVGAATFAASDIVQISSSAENDGLYEVLSHAANVLTIRGIGLTGTVEDFTQNDFTADASDSATITKGKVAVLRVGTDGKFEEASGDQTPFVFTDVLSAAAGEISALSEKSAPVQADLVVIEDSADSNAKKKVQVGSLPTRDSFSFKLNGKPSVSTKVDGAWIVPRASTITRVTLYRRTAGVSGTTTVDLNKNGTTIYTTQGNRPSVTQAGGDDQLSTTTPDVTALAQDDRVEFDIDVVESGNPQDLTLVIEVSIP